MLIYDKIMILWMNIFLVLWFALNWIRLSKQVPSHFAHSRAGLFAWNRAPNPVCRARNRLYSRAMLVTVLVPFLWDEEE